jgi:hypothetical protein
MNQAIIFIKYIMKLYNIRYELSSGIELTFNEYNLIECIFY